MYSLIHNEPRFVVISKHPNINFHQGNQPIGLVGQLRKDINWKELYPVHRLDTITSGLLVFAKNRPVAADLCVQFRKHEVERYYVAIGESHPKKKQGLVKGDMVRGRRGTWILARTSENPAKTQFFSAGLGNGYRLYILRPFTGKTHQLRVALKSLGVPVVGDPLYGKLKSDNEPFDRGYLHAYSLGFKIENEFFRFLDIPKIGSLFAEKAFQNVFTKYLEPWKLPWPKIE